MVLKGLFERLVDGVDVVYDFLYVSVSGVFAFDKLDLSSSFVGRVFDKFAAEPNCVSNRSYEVRSVVCRSMLCRKYVFWYGVYWFHRIKLIVL